MVKVHTCTGSEHSCQSRVGESATPHMQCTASVFWASLYCIHLQDGWASLGPHQTESSLGTNSISHNPVSDSNNSHFSPLNCLYDL